MKPCACDIGFWFLRCVVLLCTVWSMHAPVQAQSAPMTLNDATPVVAIWPAMRMISDPEHKLGIQDAIRVKTLFHLPSTAYGTLGMQHNNVWLHIPIAVSERSDGLWVLDIDYPVLNHVELYLVQDTQVVAHQHQGNLEPHEQRRIQGRAHSFGLQLTPGQSYDVYLHITNKGTMILPMTWNKPNAFHSRALDEQMLQGLLNGLALCLLIYSLAQWITLREHLYAKYTILVFGNTLFSLLHFGIGSQYLWHGNAWAEIHAGGLSALIAVTGSFLFNEHALSGPDLKPWLGRLMKLGAGIAAASAALYAVDVINIHVVTAVVSTIGLAPVLLALPGAIAKTRRGDSIALNFLLAWLTLFVTTILMIEVIKGRLEANFWTMHAFQFGATIDMLIFMRVLGLRTKALRTAVHHATRERDSLHTMAHTDPLTGLQNRRGFHAAVETAITHAKADDMVAVYMLDLDGFKQVNDQHGHDVGDDLLIAVARRLQSNIRNTDIISRLGGDEFVVMSSGLKSELQAQELGEKLLKAFDEPFVLTKHVCHIGLTAGYAIAPLDGNHAADLLKCADAAMYEGKKAGKHCVRRGRTTPMDLAMPESQVQPVE